MPRAKKKEDRPLFELDETQLDREWVEQPKLYFDYATQLADTKLHYEETKVDLDVVRADLDLAIRANPEDYDLDKVTEKTIESRILQEEEYKSALKKVRQAKHEVDLLQAAVVALDHRKHALQNLVSLHGQQYFAAPRADEHGREAADDLNKRAARTRRRRRS